MDWPGNSILGLDSDEYHDAITAQRQGFIDGLKYAADEGWYFKPVVKQIDLPGVDDSDDLVNKISLYGVTPPRTLEEFKNYIEEHKCPADATI